MSGASADRVPRATTRAHGGNGVWERPEASRTSAVAVGVVGLLGLLALGLGPLRDGVRDGLGIEVASVAPGDDTGDVGPEPSGEEGPAPSPDAATGATTTDESTDDGSAGAATEQDRTASEPTAREPTGPLATATVGPLVPFAGGAATLDDDGRAALDAVLAELDGAEAVTAVGWTAPGTDRAEDVELSLARAVEVAERLRELRPDLQVGTVGLGADRTAGPASTKDRVVVVLDR